MKISRHVVQALFLLSLWLGLGLQAQAQTDTVTYVYTDPQGTPLVEADAQGNVVARYDYTPYGGSVASLGNPPDGPGYTGHVNDPETGLVYMQARYYQPIGRFLSPDPVGPSSGNVYSFNRYAYADNNPIANTDPTGRNVVFSVDRNGAGGNGHTTLYFQNGQGQWYAYNEGAAGSVSSGGNLGFLLGLNAPAGVTITPVASTAVPGNTANSIVIGTTSNQDAKIATSAQASAAAYNSGKIEYNIYTNSCTVAAVNVVNDSGAGITVSDPTFTFRPNSWIDEIKSDPNAIQQQKNTPPPPLVPPPPPPPQNTLPPPQRDQDISS
ncbi:RHS repeat-associated core domain-containing protein [Rhodanobacter sp. Si-c]|uniref:RHS repeat-associated core domain-containing protein n=1 Tax=Rhodanobacter lycopersici TaxID=3162487 RepID=A0ABV3QJ19_9GAMM